MSNLHQTRALFLLKLISFVTGEYLKEIFIFIHMIISNMSPDLFAFLAILTLGVIVSYKEIGNILEQD